MSNVGRDAEGALGPVPGKPPKPAKKKREVGEDGKESKPLSKAIIGKLHIPKKGKKNKEHPEVGRSPASDAKTSTSETSTPTADATKPTPEKQIVDFVGQELNLHTSTPVKKPESPKYTSSKLLESEGQKIPEPQVKRPPSPVSSSTSTIKSDDSEASMETARESPVSDHTSDKVPDPIPDKPIPENSVKTEKKPDTDSDTSSMETAFTKSESEAQSGHKKECLYKILVIGELGTGKTSIIKRYVHQFFSQHYRATIGVDFALKVLNWDQNTIIRLQLWDIAGQERFGNMTRVYYKEAVGAFIVFDVTRAATFDAVAKWKQDLDAKVQLPDGSPIPCVLLANKCDQQKEGIVNNPAKMNEYCEEHKFSGWFETSAKENINIEEAAKTLVDQIVRNDSSNENGRNGARDLSKFPLEASEEFGEGKSCSC